MIIFYAAVVQWWWWRLNDTQYVTLCVCIMFVGASCVYRPKRFHRFFVARWIEHYIVLTLTSYCYWFCLILFYCCLCVHICAFSVIPTSYHKHIPTWLSTLHNNTQDHKIIILIPIILFILVVLSVGSSY